MNFPLFLSFWNRLQGQTTPDVHFKIATWLEKSWEQGDRYLLLMAFRSCGKSSIVGLFAAWLIYRNPNVRILVLAADQILARKMVRNVKRIIERHPLTPHLRPDRIDQWGSERFTVKRDMELRDPSMLARGISSNITGSRADVIICDDVEVPNTCATSEKRAALREQLAETSFILVPGGTQLYVGTPHSWFSIYADAPRTEIGESTPFLHHYRRLEVPILAPEGLSAWPERFPLHEIERLKRASGPNRFASQMMLQPINIAEGRLNPARLKRYRDDLTRSDELKAHFIGGKRIISVSAWWDPSFGEAGDGSVVAVIFVDEDGASYLHHIEWISARQNHVSDDDNATIQCRAVARIVQTFALPFIAVETNGIGKFLPAILRRELAKARLPCAVREMHATRAKDERILEAFDVLLAAGLLFVHDDVFQTPFITQMQEWKPGRKTGHDDALDAVAGALSLEPVRLQRLYSPCSRGAWTDKSRVHNADHEFEV